LLAKGMISRAGTRLACAVAGADPNRWLSHLPAHPLHLELLRRRPFVVLEFFGKHLNLLLVAIVDARVLSCRSHSERLQTDNRAENILASKDSERASGTMAGFGRSNSLSINTGGGSLLYVFAYLRLVDCFCTSLHGYCLVTRCAGRRNNCTSKLCTDYVQWKQRDPGTAGKPAPEQRRAVRIYTTTTAGTVGITVRRPDPVVAAFRRLVRLHEQTRDYSACEWRAVRRVDGATVATTTKRRPFRRRIRRKHTEPGPEHCSTGRTIRWPIQAFVVVSEGDCSR
jgi:hypothetical protein